MLRKDADEFVNYTVENTKGALSSNFISNFAEDANGTIWIGVFDKGFHSFDLLTQKFSSYHTEPFVKSGISRANTQNILIDSEENLWIGTTQGLFKVLKRKDGSFSIVSMADRMAEERDNYKSSNHILTLHESKDKSLWIGTRGAGLCKYDKKTKSFIWYNTQNGLSLNNVNKILESLEGNLWLSGNSGLSKLDIKTGVFTNFTSSDGLLSNDFGINSGYRDQHGVLYFGNYKGIDYFHPKDIVTNTELPSVYLRGFKLFNKEVSPGEMDAPFTKVISQVDSIALSHDQSVFTIEYSTINYTRPEKNQYAYYLEGLENSWNYVGNDRSATYTNLDYGNYLFKLKAANNDGVWNETPLELKITILPPWWKTGFAFFGYFLFFSLGLYLLNLRFKNKIKEKQLLHYERKSRAQKEKLNERKLQFFTNISHEFRTPLTLIKNPLSSIISDPKLKLPVSVREKHQIIYKNADRLTRLIDELMDFRKLELNKVRIKAAKIDVVGFVKDIGTYFTEEASSKKLDFKMKCDLDELYVWLDPSMFEKIIFNLLSNAFKVTPDHGKITINISLNKHRVLPLLEDKNSNGSFEISISDTGPGLKEKQVKKIFERFYQVDNLNKWYYGGTGIGLEVVRSFVALHKGTIDINSTVGKGTTFIGNFPLGKAHFKKEEIYVLDTKQRPYKKERMVLPVLENTNLDEPDVKNTISQTLLIVEDNTALRKYLKKELKILYKILTASNGKEGLEIAKSKLPDIIITDIIMPEMDGIEFCRKVKNNIATSHIPILMLTAKTMAKDWVEGIDSGADAYLNKPFDMPVLKSRLSQLLNSRKALV